MTPDMILLLAVPLIALFVMITMGNRSRKRMIAEMEEKQRKLREDLKPGTWVRTTSGMWARFVDQDGDVIVLEGSSGNETYWDPKAIAEIADPPFASTVQATPEIEDLEEDEHVFGLDDAPAAPAPEIDGPDADGPDADQAPGTPRA